MAFVPEDEVIEVFEECVEPAMSKMTSDPDCLPEVERYFDYLEKSYISSFGRNGKRKNPLYPPKLWNKFDVALAGTVKTSNACENWHSQIESACQTSSVWKFFKFLKQEDALMETRCDQNIIAIRHQTPPGPLEGGSRKIGVRDTAERLVNVVKKWGTIPNLKFLELIAAAQT